MLPEGDTHTLTMPDAPPALHRCKRSYSPFGADRFYNLAVYHYFDGATEAGNAAGFFRVVPGFVVQWGISGAPAVSQAWENENIPDDPMVLSNVRGTIAYAAEQVRIFLWVAYMCVCAYV
jgi:cyclophilin family peptidyl-prolyl cis-trans isomerase